VLTVSQLARDPDCDAALSSRGRFPRRRSPVEKSRELRCTRGSGQRWSTIAVR